MGFQDACTGSVEHLLLHVAAIGVPEDEEYLSTLAIFHSEVVVKDSVTRFVSRQRFQKLGVGGCLTSALHHYFRLVIADTINDIPGRQRAGMRISRRISM